jgi:hypothetical protein
MKLPAIVTEGFLQAMPPEERKRLGRAGITAAEALATFRQGEEKELQDYCYQWLNANQIYFNSDRMDKRTTGRKGRADFRICCHGLWLSAECKAEGGKLTPEQIDDASRLIRSRGRFIVVHKLKDLTDHVRRLEQVADGLIQDTFNYLEFL